MAKAKTTLPTIAMTCPNCGTSRETVQFPTDTVIVYVCECCHKTVVCDVKVNNE